MLFLAKSSSNMQRFSPNYMKRPYFKAFGTKGKGQKPNFKGHEFYKNQKMGIKQ